MMQGEIVIFLRNSPVNHERQGLWVPAFAGTTTFVSYAPYALRRFFRAMMLNTSTASEKVMAK
jgi:hypothetical protein